ncbi:MAG: YfiR family protein [Desulfobulbus sp.]|nr:YfiR family protein [Desulfobulbus sp.]
MSRRLILSLKALVHRLLLPIALILLGGLAVADAPRSASPDAASAHVDRVVAGIMGYARWPTQPETYRFCVAGKARYLHVGRDDPAQVAEYPVSVRNLTGDETGWAAACDVLYIGGVTPAQRGNLLAEAVGKPVLTISEGDSECAETSMFCLAVQGSEVGLLANLDAISRSGIRINPKVLQLARRKPSRERAE